MKNVVALIREECLSDVTQVLQDADIRGITFTGTKGFGEYINFFSRDTANTCVRIDIMVNDNKAEQVAEIIMDKAHSGLDGDGLVAILPVDKLFRIKQKKEIMDMNHESTIGPV